MSRIYCVYVGKESKENFDIGRDQHVWGWKPDAIEEKVGDTKAEDIAASMEVGDTFILGYRATGGPRVPEGGMADAMFKTVVIGRITKPLYESTDTVWPDSTYNMRVGFSLVEEKFDAYVKDWGRPEIAEALRLSGSRRGLPVEVDESEEKFTAALAYVDGLGSEDEGDEEGQSAPTASGLIDHSGDVDHTVVKKVRAEQGKLKKALFGDATTVTCALCGRELPRRVVRAAHIKARRHCTSTEYRNLANVMKACALGCDELFEHGHVYVDDEGVIRMGPDAASTQDLKQAAEALEGRTCTAFEGGSKDSKAFFAFHRQQVTELQ
ncbi:hypothetical protein [Nocardiopsis suaedae]|uniref:C2H2-type domain-containing protein n=1 Tax=Nocardiopsis suaedae TaxID=3018444 RepID=A0ABT4TPM2_9ACTN|nr:hypothetical protein [Nocardiopsis suaedae]MDA2806636.1 hypothetical protein [Nocardiopsis suaedae]